MFSLQLPAHTTTRKVVKMTRTCVAHKTSATFGAPVNENGQNTAVAEHKYNLSTNNDAAGADLGGGGGGGGGLWGF